MVRVGVVGVGHMGYNHVKTYSDLARDGVVELVGVADIDEKRVLEVGREFGVYASRDYRSLLGRVDAVSIATPTETHGRIVLDFLEAGVHVLVEKPIASSVREGLEVVKKAREKGVVLMVGHVERFNPAVAALMEHGVGQLIGQPVAGAATRSGPFEPRVAKTNVVLDLAIHDIDIFNYILRSRVVDVYARSRRVHPESVEDDYAYVTLSFENSVDAVVQVSRLTPYKRRILSLTGEKGVVEVDYLMQRVMYWVGDNTARELTVQSREPLRLELSNFVKAVEGKERPRITAEEAVYALLIAEVAVESSRLGRAISVDSYIREKQYTELL
jgi:UDP-N-acetylglucosamine 3-dehydrogenase